MRLFTIFLVWGLGKVSLAQVFVLVLRFSFFSIIQNHLLKEQIYNPHYTSWMLMSTMPICLN